MIWFRIFDSVSDQKIYACVHVVCVFMFLCCMFYVRLMVLYDLSKDVSKEVSLFVERF